MPEYQRNVHCVVESVQGASMITHPPNSIMTTSPSLICCEDNQARLVLIRFAAAKDIAPIPTVFFKKSRLSMRTPYLSIFRCLWKNGAARSQANSCPLECSTYSNFFSAPRRRYAFSTTCFIWSRSDRVIRLSPSPACSCIGRGAIKLNNSGTSPY